MVSFHHRPRCRNMFLDEQRIPGSMATSEGQASLQTHRRGAAIGYVLSMKGGLPSFNYREIRAVAEMDYRIHIFPTKISQGIYSPEPEWTLHRPKVIKAVASVVGWFLKKPRTLVRIAAEALRNRAAIEFALACQYASEMIRADVRLIHCHFADRKMFTTYFCSRLTGISYTVTVHSHELVFYSDRTLFRKALLGSDRIVAICDYNRRVLVDDFGIPSEKVVTIRLTVPLEQFSTDARMKVLTVAKFADYKGYDILAKTAGIMKDDPVVFWIVGEGPVDVPSMFASCVEHNNVKLFGSVNEELLRTLYQNADVFCLPSKTAPSGQKEGLPVSIMEAMAFGKPIVSTKHAGIPELVESVCVPENDAKAIADGLRTYLTKPSLRKTDGERNRLRVESMHGYGNIVQLAQLFESVMMRTSPANSCSTNRSEPGQSKCAE